MIYFFDTSALFKRNRTEAGSARVIYLINNQRHTSWISELSRIEFYSTLFHLHRSLMISHDQPTQLSDEFDASLTRYRITPVSPDVLAEAENLLRSEGRRFPLRTLDSLHLATFRVVGNLA